MATDCRSNLAIGSQGQLASSRRSGSQPTNHDAVTTYVKVKGRWCYLYRAIDSAGATIDFLLSAKRDADTANRLFRKALSAASHPQPRVINTDLAPMYNSGHPTKPVSSSTRPILE
jgi:transposase-like protein